MSVEVDVDLVARFTDVIEHRARAVPYGEGQLLTLPWSLHDGESVTILVDQVAPGLFRLTDRGLAADSLSLAGVDLAQKGVAQSWEAVRRSLELRPSVVPPASRFELNGDATTEELGLALTALAEAVLRADALHVLAKAPRRRTFADSVIQQAVARELAVHPRAPLRNKFGSQRPVTCSIEPDGRPDLFVQALSGDGDFHGAYDHARSLFADAALPAERLVAVVQRSTGEHWHRASLAQVSRVVDEADWPHFLDDLAA